MLSAAALLHLFLLTTPVSLDYRPGVAEAAPAPSVPAPVPPVAAPAQPRNSWYGWELLLADALFVGATVAAGDRVPALSAAGLGGLALGTPFLHLANGNGQAMLLSMLLRSAEAALVFAVISDFGRAPPPGDEGFGEEIDRDVRALAMTAILAGGLFVILDDSLRARKPSDPPGTAPAEGGAAPAASRAGPVLAPTVFVRRQGGGIGLVAAF